MPLPFYLDAARMGLMTPSTQWALQDFVRYAGENGCTLYFEQLLKSGFEGEKSAMKARFPGLKSWGGTAELSRMLRTAAGTPTSCRVLLASRATSLFKLGLSTLFRSCRRVLVTDLTWPAYARLFSRSAKRYCAKIISVPLRDAILEGKEAPEEVIRRVVSECRKQKCQGIVLPEVSHDGIRLPVAGILPPLRLDSSLRFAIVDGAQAFAHVRIQESLPACDLYLAGSHKWLGAYLPLGIGFCPRPESAERINNGLRAVDDPLLTFLHRMETGTENRFSETVHLTSLFSCRAALHDLAVSGRSVPADLSVRQANAECLNQRLSGNWQPLRPHEGLRGGSFLLQGQNESLRHLPPEELRARFLASGVALTVYRDAVLRLSMPKTPLSAQECDALANILDEIGRRQPKLFRQAAMTEQVNG